MSRGRSWGITDKMKNAGCPEDVHQAVYQFGCRPTSHDGVFGSRSDDLLRNVGAGSHGERAWPLN
jgi:hypothetical protein